MMLQVQAVDKYRFTYILNIHVVMFMVENHILAKLYLLLRVC